MCLVQTRKIKLSKNNKKFVSPPFTSRWMLHCWLVQMIFEEFTMGHDHAENTRFHMLQMKLITTENN